MTLPTLSEDQMLAVESGINNARAYESIPLPQNVVKADLPWWVHGISVDWMVNYVNRPHIQLNTKPWKSGFSIRHWEDQEYEFREPGFYYSTHPDGRGDFYSAPKMHYFLDDIIVDYHRLPDGNKDYGRPIIEKQYRFHSLPSNGLGGAKVPIRLTDGSFGYLYGAWIGQKLPGYVEVSTSAGAGWIHETLLAKLISIYQPHLGLAKVRVGSIVHMEPTLYPNCPPKEFDGAPKFYTDKPHSTRIQSYMRKRLIEQGVKPEDLPDPSTDYRGY